MKRQPDPSAGPVGHRRTREFGTVVAAQHRWVPALGGKAIQLVDQRLRGDGAFDQSTEAFAGVFVDD